MRNQRNGMKKTESVIYRDDHGVTITPVSFRVKNSIYPLCDISHHEVTTIQPKRIMAVLFVILGILIAAVSLLDDVQYYLLTQMAAISLPAELYEYSYLSEYLLVGTGAVILLAGLLLFLLKPVRYGVQINIGTLELVPVVSRQKKYVQKIADKLNTGIMRVRNGSTPGYAPSYSGSSKRTYQRANTEEMEYHSGKLKISFT